MYNPYQFNPYQNAGVYQPVPQNMSQPVQPYSGVAKKELVFVTGVEGANAYQLGANESVALFDQSNPVLYIKSTDGAGFPTVKKYMLSEYQEPKPVTPETVSIEMFNELKERLERLEKYESDLQSGKTTV